MLNQLYKYVKLLFNKLFFIVVYMNGFIQSDNIFTKILNCFSNDINLYVLENETMIPVKKLKYIEDYSASKYYVEIKFSNNCHKYLVFVAANGAVTASATTNGNLITILR